MRTDDTMTTPTSTPAPTMTPKPAPVTKSNGASKSTVKAKPPQKKVVAKKPEPASDTVTLAQLCKEAKVETKVARVRLRASKLKKNAGSWEWPKGSATLKEVRKVIAGD
jgi:hypothetical protein